MSRSGVVQKCRLAVARGTMHRNSSPILARRTPVGRNTGCRLEQRDGELEGNRRTWMKEPIVANSHEPGRQHVLEEPPEELGEILSSLVDGHPFGLQS